VVSDKTDADAQSRSHSFDDDKVPIFFQSGFHICLTVALVDAGIRPIFERRAKKGDPENDCRQCGGQDKNSVGHVVQSLMRDQSY